MVHMVHTHGTTLDVKLLTIFRSQLHAVSCPVGLPNNFFVKGQRDETQAKNFSVINLPSVELGKIRFFRVFSQGSPLVFFASGLRGDPQAEICFSLKISLPSNQTKTRFFEKNNFFWTDIGSSPKGPGVDPHHPKNTYTLNLNRYLQSLWIISQ